jgi:predicted kinase
MLSVILADPSLVVLVGPAGAGKSSFAARHFASDEILSSDRLRAEIAGDERDQRATSAAFAALHRSLVRRARARQLTVVDATNVERPARRALLRRARAARVPAVAIILDLPAPLVLARNAGRTGRVVHPWVVRQHLATLRREIDQGAFDAEPWALVIRVRESRQLDRLTVSRRR